MKASLIIPTYNGARKLRDTLDALCLQTTTDFETIVVIDGSTDGSEEVVKEYVKRLAHLTVHIQPNKGRSGARNAGVRESSCELLIFLDDDSAVGIDNVERHIKFHHDGVGDVLVGMPMLDPERIRGNPFLEYRAKAEQRWNAKFRRGINKVTFSDYVFTSQNVSLKKSDFLSAGGFDERLTDSEDFDLSVRLLKANLKIFYDTTLEVLHHDFADIVQTIDRQVQYYRVEKKILTIHPEYRELLPGHFQWAGKTRKDTLKYFVFEKIPGWMALFNSSFFKLMPAAIRNNLYSQYIYTKSVLRIKKR